MSIALIAKHLNMFFNNIPQVEIKTGDSINSPQLSKEGKLARFDRVIAEIPFGIKIFADNILNGDPYNRFVYRSPSQKQERIHIYTECDRHQPDRAVSPA